MEEKERPQDELRATPIVITGIVGSILVFAMIVGLSALFVDRQQEEVRRKQSLGAAPDARLLRSEQLEKLSVYRILDEESGTVRIPIEAAMKLVVSEHGR